MARLLHSLQADDVGLQFALLTLAQDHLMRGGPKRAKYTLPALGFCGLRLLRRLTAAPADPGAPPPTVPSLPAAADAARPTGAVVSLTVASLLQWLLGVAAALAEVPEPLLALRLLLTCAQAASQEAGEEMLAYECMEQVCVWGGRRTQLLVIGGVWLGGAEAACPAVSDCQQSTCLIGWPAALAVKLCIAVAGLLILVM